MYQRARKLQELIIDAVSFASLAEDQLEAYNVAINSLSLVDQNNAWFLLPISTDTTHEVCFYSFAMIARRCLQLSAKKTKKAIQTHSRESICPRKI